MKDLSWTGHVARTGRRKLHIVFGRKSEENRPLRRPRDRWDDDIKVEVK
jgi:hypothetical protein